MNAQEIRRRYLSFFATRGHTIIPSAPLVPYNDPTTLFTGSGMQPMIPYLLGEDHPKGKRLANSQVCLRAQDIDDVGDESHTTTFEMLGNWSLGDYFKTEQIKWIAQFLFDEVGLDPERVYVSCYIGNEKYGIPRDEQAINLWREEFKNAVLMLRSWKSVLLNVVTKLVCRADEYFYMMAKRIGGAEMETKKGH